MQRSGNSPVEALGRPLAAFALVLLLAGCTESSTCDNVFLDAEAPGSPDVVAPDGGAAVDLGGGLDTKPPEDPDTWTAPRDVSRPDVPPDSGPDIPRFSGVWENPTCFGRKPIGASCADHCECETGYCYDEVWLAPFRFCTKFCAGLAEGCGVENACLNADSPHFAETYYITLTWFCMPRCAGLADCSAIDPAYDHCPHPRVTSWDGRMIGPATCMVGEE